MDRDELDAIADDQDLPTTAELLEMVRGGSYDVPTPAHRLGLSERHVRMILAIVAVDQ